MVEEDIKRRKNIVSRKSNTKSLNWIKLPQIGLYSHPISETLEF